MESADNMHLMLDVLIGLWPAKNGSVKSELEGLKDINWNEESLRAGAAYKVLQRIEDSKIGKGIFAQTLADRLSNGDVRFVVPKYIKNAVIWACGGNLDDA
jgi:hypothetical protein